MVENGVDLEKDSLCRALDALGFWLSAASGEEGTDKYMQEYCDRFFKVDLFNSTVQDLQNLVNGFTRLAYLEYFDKDSCAAYANACANVYNLSKSFTRHTLLERCSRLQVVSEEELKNGYDPRDKHRRVEDLIRVLTEFRDIFKTLGGPVGINPLTLEHIASLSLELSMLEGCVNSILTPIASVYGVQLVSDSNVPVGKIVVSLDLDMKTKSWPKGYS